MAAVIEASVSTFFDALDDEDKVTAKLYVQKAAQAAEEAWQQTIGGLQGLSVTNPAVAALEHSSSASQDENSEDMDFSAPRKRLNAPQLQAQLSRLTDRTQLGRLKSTRLSAGSVLRPHDYITNVQKRLGNRPWKWKHENQMALLRRRASMTRAVLPNPSARAEWLLASIIDGALRHWGHVPPLHGGIGDHDHADSETDTATLDDDDDIASLASQPSASLQLSSL